jgi:hypothetical protein
MGLFRQRTIFHAEDSLPDPEEIKLRFRRRILWLTFFGFLLVLAIPVIRDLRSNLEARSEARRFAQWMIEARTSAAASRAPVALHYNASTNAWTRSPCAAGTNCSAEVPGPAEQWPASEARWTLQYQPAAGETLSAKRICFHPNVGLELDSSAVTDGKLLITVLPGSEGAKPAYILVTDGGADIQLVTH